MPTPSARDLIDHLGLIRHPEGGWFRETYRSDETLHPTALPERYAGARAHSTAIYYLLERGDFSALHRIKSDEIWHFHCGSALAIHVIAPDGSYRRELLGPAVRNGQQFQVVVPGGCWFGAELHDDGFALVGCTVSPGFHFDDFEMAERAALIAAHPQHADMIERMTRGG